MENNKNYIFATNDKNLYDIYYEKKIPFSPELSKFPTLSTFNSETDFGSATHFWKKQVKEKIKNVAIPVPLSLSVYTPEIAELQNNINQNNNKKNEPSLLRTSPDSKHFDYRHNPPLPVTIPELFDQFITENPSEDGKNSFSNISVHIRNQKVIDISNYVQDEPKWGSNFIPQEPSPELFDTYESYKKSLKNWAALQSQKDSLLHPSDFISSIGIVHTENDSLKESKTNLILQNESDIENEKYESYENKIFNEKEFLDMESKKIPNSQMLIQLFNLSYKNQASAGNSFSLIKYSYANTPNVKALSNLLPFKVPYTKKALINKVEETENSNAESSRIIRIAKLYKNITDPYIEKIFIPDIKSTEMTLYTDFSAIQTAEALTLLTPQQYDSLTKSLPFFLHQLNVIKSSRVLCRLFIIISNILETKPKLISTFFANFQTLSNVAQIIAEFSFLDIRIYSYDDSFLEEPENEVNSKAVTTEDTDLNKRKLSFHSNNDAQSKRRKSTVSIRKPLSIVQSQPSDIKKSVDDLLFFLLASQLLKVLISFVEKYQPKNRNLLLQINAQTITFSRSIDMSLKEKVADIEAAFLNPTPKICVIFHFLCDYDPVSLSNFFQTNPFYIFLGKVFLSSSCNKYYGEMCGHVLRIPKLRRIFFLQFFHLHYWMSSKQIMMTIVPTCNFLATLIKQEAGTDSENDISVDELFTIFMNATQLVSLSPSDSLNLIGAIISFLVKLMKRPHKSVSNASNNNNSNTVNSITNTNSMSNNTNNVNRNSSPRVVVANPQNQVSNTTANMNSNFEMPRNKAFAHIRESLITLFKYPILSSNNIVTLYELISMMLIPYENDAKAFIERYLSTIILVNMKSSDETIAVASWDVFRELFFDPNCLYLRDSQSIKASLTTIASSKNLIPPILIEILFLALGITNKTFSFSSPSSERYKTKKKKVRKSISVFDQSEGYVIPGINPRDIYQNVLNDFEEGKLKKFTNEVLTLKVMMPNFKWRKRTTSS